MKKKVFALLLAATMTLGASMTVFAADNTTINDTTGLATGAEIEGETEVKIPTIEVVVPSTTTIVINPFSLSYESTDKSITGNSQIISAEQEIQNKSDVALAVNVASLTATPSTPGDTAPKIVTAAPTKSTGKEVFLYLEVQNKETAFETAYNTKSTQQLVATDSKSDTTGKTKAASKANIITVPAKASDSTASVAKFKFGGSVVTNPVIVNSTDKTTTQNPWTDADKVTVSLKFTFTPQAATNN